MGMLLRRVLKESSDPEAQGSQDSECIQRHRLQRSKNLFDGFQPLLGSRLSIVHDCSFNELEVFDLQNNKTTSQRRKNTGGSCENHMVVVHGFEKHNYMWCKAVGMLRGWGTT